MFSMNSDKQSGFSLIELLTVVLIINILAATAITFYIGLRDKSRRSVIIRTASSATDEVNLWLQASLSPNRDNRDVDSNLDGKIDLADKTNEKLHEDGVAMTYANNRNDLGESSPWFNADMWYFTVNKDDLPNGRISLIQVPTSKSRIRIVGKGKTGITLFENNLSVD